MTMMHFGKALASFSVLLLATALQAQTTDANQPSTGSSKVRIVRLSQVKGDVQIDRNTGRGFEAGITNLPVVESSQLRTGVGVAEVEFEDNSTLRLAPDSLVSFPRLERLSTGGTNSSVLLLKGTAYVSLLKTPNNHFKVLLGTRELDLQPATHIRLEVDGSKAELAVLDGMVHLDSPAGAVDVTKKKTATFEIVDQSQPAMAKNIVETPFDAWDQKAAEYHSRAASFSALNSPYAYGAGDMMYYGSFNNMAGCGSMWRPYFADAAFDPYANGAWAWYPGAGYSWVSPYPWGWTPYHSGSWAYCSGSGWGWQPGMAWNGINNIASFSPGSGGRSVPVPPIHAPRPGEPTLNPISLKPLVSSDLASGNSFLFRKGSAGMGIPRDTLGKLDKLSRQADSRGSASVPVYLNTPPTANGRLTYSQTMAASIQRGSAAPPHEPMTLDRPSAGQSNAGPSRGSQTRPSAPVASAPRK